ncbi:hypothetical protein MMC13_000907, partial [Lambiella insularis]|nr:hypothetical protein [Lambiella insularis]
MSELLKFLLSHEEQFRRARLPSLYSDFRLQQATNPDGFEANLIAWETGLTHAVKAGLIPGGRDVFSLRMGEPLLRALETREWGRPLALAPVIAAAVLDGRMISSEDFLTARTSIYDRQWSLAPWQFVSRGLKMLGLTGLRSTKAMATAGRYVLVKNVE